MSKDPRTVILFVLGVALGGLSVYLWLMPGGDVVPERLDGGSEREMLTPDLSGSVSVGEQDAGMTVVVDSVTVPPPGVWVAVHEVQGAMLGNILGAARARGPVSHLSVPLLRATTPMQSYAIVLYRDDGDDLFELGEDSVYVDFETSKPVVAPFATR